MKESERREHFIDFCRAIDGEFKEIERTDELVCTLKMNLWTSDLNPEIIKDYAKIPLDVELRLISHVGEVELKGVFEGKNLFRASVLGKHSDEYEASLDE